MPNSFFRRTRNNFWAVAMAGLLALGLQPASFGAVPSPEQIDWDRARQLYQKSQRGETLSPEDSAYLERAKAERRKSQANGRDAQPEAAGNPDLQRARQLLQKRNQGQPLTDEEQAFLKQVREKMARPAAGSVPVPPARESTGLVPLDELTSTYKGQDGGLYGGGRNQPPAELRQAALAQAAKMLPLDEAGKPSPSGKIVLLSIGMSNTTQEYSRFKQLADSDPAKAPQVVVVDGAQGGQDAARWSTDDANAWRVLAERLKAAGVSPNQVQAVWMKHARIAPSKYGEFPKHTEELQGHIVASLQLAKKRFPNLHLAYLSSRIYAGYATTGLNPEPYAYEGAFAVRGLILNQVKGDPALNWDPAKGEVKAPLLLWGPYLWCDGMTPRKSDGLVWKREDCAGDGTHPSPGSGREKVARLLLNFLKTDATAKPWFTGKQN